MMKARPVDFRVRVRRAVEDWVEVRAMDAVEAEVLAGQRPGVISVVPNTAIRAVKVNPDVPVIAVAESGEDEVEDSKDAI